MHKLAQPHRKVINVFVYDKLDSITDANDTFYMWNNGVKIDSVSDNTDTFRFFVDDIAVDSVRDSRLDSVTVNSDSLFFWVDGNIVDSTSTIEDEGWIKVKTNPGYQNFWVDVSGEFIVRYRKYGKRVFIVGLATVTFVNRTKVIFILPAGY